MFFLLADSGVHDGSDLRDAVGTRRRGQHRARGEQHLETHLDDRSPQTNTITADDSSEYAPHIIYHKHWRIQGGRYGRALPSLLNFFHFHVIFGKNFAK